MYCISVLFKCLNFSKISIISLDLPSFVPALLLLVWCRRETAHVLVVDNVHNDRSNNSTAKHGKKYLTHG